MFPQLNGGERQEVEWHEAGKTGACAARHADRQATDGLGSKPGEGLPFLDGGLPDAVRWLKKIKGGESAPALLRAAQGNAAEQTHSTRGENIASQLKSRSPWSGPVFNLLFLTEDVAPCFHRWGRETRVLALCDRGEWNGAPCNLNGTVR